MPYRMGVFDGCSANTIIDHAVLSVGYGVEECFASFRGVLVECITYMP